MSSPSPSHSPTDLKQSLLAALRKVHPPLVYSELDKLMERLERAAVIEPTPTNAELLEALRLELGPGWRVDPNFKSDNTVYAATGPTEAYLTRAALLKPNGPKRTADALRWLAGQEGQ